MPEAGDSFVTKLKQSHLEWGTHRHTSTRGIIYGEGYLQIPRNDAIRIGIYNSNNPEATNTFNCNSVDGFLSNALIKASGSSSAGDIYAKQFQGNGNLQLFGDWFRHVNAQVGNKVKVTWVTSTDITVELI